MERLFSGQVAYKYSIMVSPMFAYNATVFNFITKHVPAGSTVVVVGVGVMDQLVHNICIAMLKPCIVLDSFLSLRRATNTQKDCELMAASDKHVFFYDGRCERTAAAIDIAKRWGKPVIVFHDDGSKTERFNEDKR